MKRLFIFALFVFSIFVATAQRFEWAKGYTVLDHREEYIESAATDSLGNLYILGRCDASSVWNDTEYITPSINRPTKDFPLDALIAKISTEGEMVWKKVVFCQYSNADPSDMKKIGDTAIACMINFAPPHNSNYTYYLDTFLFGFSDYPIDVSHLNTGEITAFLVFDFDGNIIEQHYLWITYTDADGNDITITYPNDTIPWFGAQSYIDASFDIDLEGNIYVSRRAYDLCSADSICSVENGAIHGMKFWVDRRLVGEYRIEGKRKLDESQILKFSPHFDTLQVCRYVLEGRVGIPAFTEYESKIRVDQQGNLYYMQMFAILPDTLNILIFDSLSDVSHSWGNENDVVSYLVKFGTDLDAKWIIAFDNTITQVNRLLGMYVWDFTIDEDSNLVFIYPFSLRSTYRDTVNMFSTLTYHGRILDLKGGAFFCAFENVDSNPPPLHSYGEVPSKYAEGSKPGGICKNNRVFLQSMYGGGITFPSQTITHGTYEDGYALTVFDYSGRVIDGIDYGVVSRNVNHYAGPTVLHDSVLYLCTLLSSSAQFGDISFPVYGETNVIAKYVDTAFMHLYVRPTHGISTVSAVEPRVYPVPATDRLHFDCPAGSVPTAVAAISLSGWRMPLTATASSADVSCLAPGVYLLEITTPKDKYYTKFIKVRGER